MEKISLANWNQVFGKAEQETLFATDRYRDFRLRFDEPGLVSGCLHSLDAPGMQLTELRLNSKNPVRLAEDEPCEAVESAFIVNGRAESAFENLSSPVRLTKGSHNLQYNREFCGTHTVSPDFHAYTITYDLAFLDNILQTHETANAGRFVASLQRRENFLAADRSMCWQARFTDILQSLKTCPFKGITRYLFFEGKMMELLALQLEQVEEANSQACNDWSAADRERLHAVKEFIEQHFAEAFSLKDLACRFCLNEFKLKKGYKDLFGTTVFGYVHRLRMQKAKQLLLDGGTTVAEAAFFIGYQNVSSFCTEFKKRFGFSPGQLSNRLGLSAQTHGG